MATPYQTVAKAALINWNGLSEEEAESKIQNESVQELEGQVYAMNSIKYAVVGIAKEIGLTEEETTNFFEAVIYGPENAEIFSIVSKKAQGFTEEQKLGVLTTIHDGWVIGNCDEKTFNKKVGREQLRQYAPLELIGWNEVKSDLLFLKPILASIGIQVDEIVLSEAYHIKVAKYMEEKQINSEEDLMNLVRKGKEYYAVLPKELEERLLPMTEDVTSQLIQNWTKKDPETIQMFLARQESKGGIKL